MEGAASTGGGGRGEEIEGTTRKNIAHQFMWEPKCSILNNKRRGERKRNYEEEHLMLIHAGAQVLILIGDVVLDLAGFGGASE